MFTLKVYLIGTNYENNRLARFEDLSSIHSEILKMISLVGLEGLLNLLLQQQKVL